MKRILFLVLFVAMTMQLSALSESSVMALFVYRFTKVIEWPEETQVGMFRIGVVGSFEAYKEIMDIAMGRNVGNQNIEVMNIVNIDQVGLSDFHMLIVGEGMCEPEYMKQIMFNLKSGSTLIIAEKNNYNSDGICISFNLDKSDLSYIYSYPLIQRKGLKCSHDFLARGTGIN